MRSAGSSRGARAPRPTMADVGRLAGVSPTAVSFVINGRASGEISEQTRDRVLEAVRTLGYRPNRTARGLRTRRTHTIGFLSDAVAGSPPDALTLAGAHDAAWRHGSRLLLAQLTPGTGTGAELPTIVDDLLDRQVDALLVTTVGAADSKLATVARHVPTVVVNGVATGVPYVLPAERQGARAATNLLLAAGHRRIGFLCGRPGSWPSRDRLVGHRGALAAAGSPYHPGRVLPGEDRIDSGYERTALLLGHRAPPTALICGAATVACGAYLALREAGLRVPQDVSVLAYDDEPALAAQLRPPLSTVHLPFYEMGEWAVHRLLHPDQPGRPERSYLPCPVVRRGSVALAW